MAEENPQPPHSAEQPSPAPQQQRAQQPGTPQGRNSSGQRRNRGHSRHYDGRQDRHRRDQHPSPQPATPGKPSESPQKTEDIDDEEETEQDRSSPQGRRRYRGGRPPKKIIEEWASDPYCE